MPLASSFLLLTMTCLTELRNHQLLHHNKSQEIVKTRVTIIIEINNLTIMKHEHVQRTVISIITHYYTNSSRNLLHPLEINVTFWHLPIKTSPSTRRLTRNLCTMAWPGFSQETFKAPSPSGTFLRIQRTFIRRRKRLSHFGLWISHVSRAYSQVWMLNQTFVAPKNYKMIEHLLLDLSEKRISCLIDCIILGLFKVLSAAILLLDCLWALWITPHQSTCQQCTWTKPVLRTADSQKDPFSNPYI